MVLAVLAVIQSKDFPEHGHSYLKDVVGKVEIRIVQGRLIHPGTNTEEPDGTDTPKPAEVL